MGAGGSGVWMDGWMGRRMDGRMKDGWMDGWMDGSTDGQCRSQFSVCVRVCGMSANFKNHFIEEHLHRIQTGHSYYMLNFSSQTRSAQQEILCVQPKNTPQFCLLHTKNRGKRPCPMLFCDTVYDFVHLLLAAGTAGPLQNRLLLLVCHGGIDAESAGIHGQRHTQTEGKFIKILSDTSIILLRSA